MFKSLPNNFISVWQQYALTLHIGTIASVWIYAPNYISHLKLSFIIITSSCFEKCYQIIKINAHIALGC